LFPWRAGEEEQEGLRPWRKESPAALLGLPIGEENRRVSHGHVEEAAVTADQSPSSAAAHPCPPLEARPPLPSAGRIGSVCTTPFLGRVGGAPENGWLNGSSVGEGLGKLPCDFEPLFRIWDFRWSQL
jgi:hypothetical protein